MMTFISAHVPNYSMKIGDCKDNDLPNQRFQFGEPKECAAKCSSNSACVGFAWAPKIEPTCFLKHTMCSSLTPNPDVTAYFKDGRCRICNISIVCLS